MGGAIRRLGLMVGAVTAMLLAPVAASAAACPQIEVMSAATGVVRATDGTRQPAQAPIIALADITEAVMSWADGEYGVGFDLTPAAGARLRAAVSAGARPVFLLDGGQTAAVRVLDPSFGDAFWVSPYTPDEARRLAARVGDCLKRR